MASRDDIMKFLLEDDAKVTVADLGQAIAKLSEQMELVEILTAPKNEDRMFRSPYQRALVNPGQEGEIYRQQIPSGFVGVITRVGNTWFPNTFYVRVIDNKVPEPRIERSIAPINEPAQVKVFTRTDPIWRAQNNDAVPHTFEVVMDGFLLPQKVADRIMAIEGSG